MVAPRAIWKGFLKLGSVSCSVKLIGATSEAERVHFRILDRRSRLPVKSEYVDEITGKPVGRDDQIKGYELNAGDIIHLEPDDIKKLKVQSEHTLIVDGFVDKAAVGSVYFEKPYYLIPADRPATEPFAIIRDAMKRQKKIGVACIVLYQRERQVIIEPYEDGIVMTTLRHHDEVVAADSVFKGLKSPKIDPEMAEIAELIIEKKMTKFDPTKFEDRYEDALLELINTKKTGKKPPKAAPRPKENIVKLADVLRKSLKKEGLKMPGKKTIERKKSA
jgi:DNA end-binding protein Ku